VHRELRRFVDAGIVRRDARQRPHGYAAATDAPAYEPLRALMEMTAGVPVRLADALDDVPGVRAAAIHGSWAAGRIRPHSDLDVVIVTEGDRRSAQRAVRRVGREIGRDVDVSVMSVRDYEELMRSQNPFLTRIVRGPRIDVVGNLVTVAE
jgi:predicted nucleotidyltransferase